MANRIFVIGDLVISITKGLGVVTGVIPVLSVDFNKPIQSFYFYSDTSDIKTIRTPRKGSKEARDIVAMMLWTHRRQVQFYIFVACGFERPVDNEVIKQRYMDWKDTKLYCCIEKAKSMLK